MKCEGCDGNAFQEDTCGSQVCVSCGRVKEQTVLLEHDTSASNFTPAATYRLGRTLRCNVYDDGYRPPPEGQRAGTVLIQEISRTLCLNNAQVQDAVKLFEMAYQKEKYHYRHLHRKKILAVCCLYILCRQNKLPVTVKQVCELSQITTADFSLMFRDVVQELDQDIPNFEFEGFVEGFCNKLNLERNVIQRTLKMIPLCNLTGNLIGYSYELIVAPMVYIAWQTENVKINGRVKFKKFCEDRGLTVHKKQSVRTHLKEIQSSLKKLAIEIPWVVNPEKLNDQSVLHHIEDVIAFRMTLFKKHLAKWEAKFKEFNDSLPTGNEDCTNCEHCNESNSPVEKVDNIEASSSECGSELCQKLEKSPSQSGSISEHCDQRVESSDENASLYCSQGSVSSEIVAGAVKNENISDGTCGVLAEVCIPTEIHEEQVVLELFNFEEQSAIIAKCSESVQAESETDISAIQNSKEKGVSQVETPSIVSKSEAGLECRNSPTPSLVKSCVNFELNRNLMPIVALSMKKEVNSLCSETNDSDLTNSVHLSPGAKHESGYGSGTSQSIPLQTTESSDGTCTCTTSAVQESFDSEFGCSASSYQTVVDPSYENSTPADSGSQQVTLKDDTPFETEEFCLGNPISLPQTVNANADPTGAESLNQTDCEVIDFEPKYGAEENVSFSETAMWAHLGRNSDGNLILNISENGFNDGAQVTSIGAQANSTGPRATSTDAQAKANQFLAENTELPPGDSLRNTNTATPGCQSGIIFLTSGEKLFCNMKTEVEEENHRIYLSDFSQPENGSASGEQGFKVVNASPERELASSSSTRNHSDFEAKVLTPESSNVAQGGEVCSSASHGDSDASNSSKESAVGNHQEEVLHVTGDSEGLVSDVGLRETLVGNRQKRGQNVPEGESQRTCKKLSHISAVKRKYDERIAPRSFKAARIKDVKNTLVKRLDDSTNTGIGNNVASDSDLDERDMSDSEVETYIRTPQEVHLMSKAISKFELHKKD